MLSYKRINPQLTVIMVGNKIDLVRSRAVDSDEGRTLAQKFEVKWIETSTTFEHNVDELLVSL